ncbi:hypothetical protein GCM10010191_61130 [Actinomadura vinacea]|uniref:ABC transmembrane type-1 domain-containing protein n=1 Tax=Actinomadura vinacea TaxID=115336 RepID=A0ABP5WZN3_9ACTN
MVYLGLQMPLAVFLYTGFFRGLPTAYEEAARVDGARPLRLFVQIVFPLVGPVTGVVATLTGAARVGLTMRWRPWAYVGTPLFAVFLFAVFAQGHSLPDSPPFGFAGGRASRSPPLCTAASASS